MTKEKGQVKEVVNVRGMSDDEFIEKYGRLVHHCVWKRYAKKKASIERDTGLDIEDLTQFGMIGLIKARDNFDLEFGCAFSTYAVPKILGEIGRAIRDNQKIKVQRTVYGVKGKILNQQLTDKEPEEIADILDEPVALVKTALEYQPSTDSLNKVVYASGANEEITLERMIEDTKTEDIEETTINRAVIREFKAALPPKEYIVLDMRLQNMTQQNIANQMGYSQVQISRILAKINQRAVQFGKEGGLQD